MQAVDALAVRLEAKFIAKSLELRATGGDYLGLGKRNGILRSGLGHGIRILARLRKSLRVRSDLRYRAPFFLGPPLMSPSTRRLGILTGGGDCPGLNAVLRAVAKTAILQYGIEVIGIEDGFKASSNTGYAHSDSRMSQAF